LISNAKGGLKCRESTHNALLLVNSPSHLFVLVVVLVLVRHFSPCFTLFQTKTEKPSNLNNPNKNGPET